MRIAGLTPWRHAAAFAGMAAWALGTAQAQTPPPRDPPPPATTPGRALPPAVIDETLEIGGQDIEGRKIVSRMTVAVKVNGQGPYRFVVDSGADSSVIGAEVARTLQLPPGDPVLLHGMTANSNVRRAFVESLELGQSAFHNRQLPVLLERDVGGQGMVGIDALVNQRLMLDFERRTIKVEDARRPAPRLDGEIVVIAHRHRGQLILTQVSVNGKPVSAVIDTGSEVTIGNLKLRELLVRRYGKNFFPADLIGVTGDVLKIDMARVNELRLGPVLLQDVPIAFADVPPFAVFDLMNEPALLLGTDLMETFRRVSLDFRARKVRFQLRSCASRGIVLTTDPFHSDSRLSSNAGTACAQ